MEVEVQSFGQCGINRIPNGQTIFHNLISYHFHTSLWYVNRIEKASQNKSVPQTSQIRSKWLKPTHRMQCCIWIKVADLAPWFQHTNYLSMTYKLVQRQLVAKILSQFSARQLERNITRNQKVTPVLLYSFKRNICANSKNSPPWISLK